MRVRYLENIDREWSVEPDAGRLFLAVELQESNPEDALKIFYELERIGSNLAKCYIGDSYANERGVDRNVELGMQWYRKASESGSIEASHRLAFWLWHYGEYEQSIEMLKDIAERGFSPAMFLLGSIYYWDLADDVVEKDITLSVHYWKMAEAAGHLIAKRRLSIFLRTRNSGVYDRVRGYWKLIRLLPSFIYCSIKSPSSDRVRGWSYGAGLGCTDLAQSDERGAVR